MLHAVYSLKETVDFYINHGSIVYYSLMDVFIALDRLIHLPFSEAA